MPKLSSEILKPFQGWRPAPQPEASTKYCDADEDTHLYTRQDHESRATDKINTNKLSAVGFTSSSEGVRTLDDVGGFAARET